MRIGVIAYPLDRPVGGGIDRYAHGLCREFLRKRGADEFVFIHGRPFPPGSPYHGTSDVLLPEAGLFGFLKRWSWGRRNPAGLDVLWGPYFGIIPGPFATVLTIADLYSFTSRDEGWVATTAFRLSTSRMIRASDWITTISKATREQVLTLFGDLEERVVVVPIAIDPPPPAPAGARQSLREDFGFDPDARVILFVGALIPRKDPVNLVRAFAKVHKSVPSARLALCGAHAWGYPAVEKEIKQLGLTPFVRCPGFVSEEFLERAYYGSDVFVLPSRFEGFGMPAVEAMARGLPAVLSDGGALREVGEHSAALVKAGDADALAQAVIRVLTDPGHSGDLRSQGLKQAAEFTWERSAQELRTVFGRAAKRQ